MDRDQSQDRRAQRASEPDWSSELDSTTELPEYSDAEFSHLDQEVVQQMEEVFGPAPDEPEAEGPEETEGSGDDSSFVSDINIRLTRAREQVLEALRTSRESRDENPPA